jgi:hypothetical protein
MPTHTIAPANELFSYMSDNNSFCNRKMRINAKFLIGRRFWQIGQKSGFAARDSQLTEK